MTLTAQFTFGLSHKKKLTAKFDLAAKDHLRGRPEAMQRIDTEARWIVRAARDKKRLKLEILEIK